MASFTPLPLYTPVPIAYEAGWAPEPVWTLWRTENIFPLPGTELRMSSPSPYQMSYPGLVCVFDLIFAVRKIPLCLISTVYITAPSVAETTQCPVVALLTNDEFKSVWKEANVHVTYFKVLHRHSPRSKVNHKKYPHIRWPGRYSNHKHTEYKSEALPPEPINEWWNVKDQEGSGHTIFRGTVLEFTLDWENHESALMSRPRFEPGTSKMQILLCTLTRTWLRSSQQSYLKSAPSLAYIKYKGMNRREPLFSVSRYTIFRYRAQPEKKEKFQDILIYWMSKMRNIQVNHYTEAFPSMDLLQTKRSACKMYSCHCAELTDKILWHVDPLLINGSERSYTTAVSS
jgi:hypothetical protein